MTRALMALLVALGVPAFAVLLARYAGFLAGTTMATDTLQLAALMGSLTGVILAAVFLLVGYA